MSRLEDIRNTAKQTQEAGSNVLQGPTPKGIVKDPYAAFGSPTADPQIRLVIYAKRFFMMPQYSLLYDVFFDGAGEYIGLVFPHHTVKLYGRNLLSVIEGLRTNRVEWIREYVEFFHELPLEEDAPVITSIDTAAVQNPFLSKEDGGAS